MPVARLTAAALILPGVAPVIAQGLDDDSVDFQYSHYQEGKRELFTLDSQPNPIEVEGLHGGARVSITDRIKFAFNYAQDTWGGATPIATMPLALGTNALVYDSTGLTNSIVGASPYLVSSSGNLFLDKNNRFIERIIDEDSGNYRYRSNNQLVHTLAEASPEVRKQGDFKITYAGDEAALDIGGGLSLENDYESVFGNLNTRWDFNQKLTTVRLGLGYTHNETLAVIDHDASPYLLTDKAFDPLVMTEDGTFARLIYGKKQDWSVNLGLSQIMDKHSVVEANLDYVRSTGYMENPYKAVGILFVNPEAQDPNSNCPEASMGLKCLSIGSIMEQRPDERNQWTGALRYVRHIDTLDAAVHLGYRLFSDDWGITTHTFDADWVQPLGQGWTLTPRVRYYSQDAADFYTPFIMTRQGQFNNIYDRQGRAIMLDGGLFNPETGPEYFYDKASGQYFDAQDRNVTNRVEQGELLLYNKTKRFTRASFPKFYSSDHRLSGFGALSGGVTLSKQFARGLALELDFEYYTHQGGLKIGSGGEADFADFDYWTANAALKVDLGQMASSGVSSSGHHSHHHSTAMPPAGVMFGHALTKAGDMMVGYRYQWSNQSGNLLDGTNPVQDYIVLAKGCGSDPCYIAPADMSMHMHMLDLMYAPTDWLTLMLMPQFMDMDMSLRGIDGNDRTTLGHSLGGHYFHHIQNGHQTGGIGDLGMYPLFKLFDNPNHRLHLATGFTAPTGDVDLKLRRNHGIDGGFIHYGMQLGSGTWDFKPSLTYAGETGILSWGGQVAGTVRMESRNKSGYALGDIFQATAWAGYRMKPWLCISLRGMYTNQGEVRGSYVGASGQFSAPDGLFQGPDGQKSSIYKYGPMDYPQNYGGQFWDIGLGVSAAAPGGSLEGNRVSVEWLQPVHTDVNGIQLDRDGALAFTWDYGF